jgi:4-amino-4-deoxy-L-arabinose transferase-like glycosyltransferase
MRNISLRNIVTIGIFLFSIFILFYNLGGVYLENWDEAMYVLMSQTAIQKGDYLALEYQNAIHWCKTPFPLYPMIVSFKLFGINEFSARLSSSLFGIGILFLIFIIAKQYYGQWTAIFAVLITATIHQFIFYHGLKTANVDSITLFFLVSTICCWLLLKKYDHKIILTCACLGLTFLCKGPIIIIPLCVISFSLIVEKPFEKSFLKPLFVGVVVSSIIVLPWYIYMYYVYGNEFIKGHILYNFMDRYFEGIEGHKKEGWYYIKNLIDSRQFIWFGTAFVSFLYFLIKFLRERRLIEFVLISWVLVTFVIVNISQTKLWWYMFPIYPPLAIMSAKTLKDFLDEPNLLNSSACAVGLLTILTFVLSRHRYYELLLGKNFFSQPEVLAVGIVLLFVCIAYILKNYFATYQKGFRIFLILILFIIPMYQSFKLTLRKDLNHPVLSIAGDLHAAESVDAFRLYPGDVYYLSKQVHVKEFINFSDLEKLRGHVVLARNDEMKKLTLEDLKGTLQVTYQGNSYPITVVKSNNGYSILRID